MTPSSTPPIAHEPAIASGAPPSTVFRIEDVTVNFTRKPVLRRLNFEIRRGETVAIIGQSGCGKTVLLKVLIALLRPTAGSVSFDGLKLASLSEKQLATVRMRVGFLFQGAALFDSLTVFENVAFALREHTRKTDAEIEELVFQRLREVGLSPDIRNAMPAELSGGMRKRVGLARALVMGPEVLLYDEPTTGLDPVMSQVINELIVETRKRHPVTSVVVTHDMRTVQTVADRVIMLYPLSRLRPDENQILFEGTPAELEASADPRVRRFVRGDAENGSTGL